MSIEGVILAAGMSTRTGKYKMLLPFGGKTILESCIEGMYKACSRIIVVGGYNIENIVPISDKYKKVRLVYNPNYSSGMFSSVKIGINQVKADYFFLTPGDYPLISRTTYEVISNAEGDIVIPTHEGRKGHPVFMDSRHIYKILEQPIGSSLRDYINLNRYQTIEVDDAGILMDVDTMDDYNVLINYQKDIRLGT